MNFSFNLILILIISEILRKQNTIKQVEVIVRSKFGINPIFANSKLIIVGIEIIRPDNAIKLYIVNFLVFSKLKYSLL